MQVRSWNKIKYMW